MKSKNEKVDDPEKAKRMYIPFVFSNFRLFLVVWLEGQYNACGRLASVIDVYCSGNGAIAADQSYEKKKNIAKIYGFTNKLFQQH